MIGWGVGDVETLGWGLITAVGVVGSDRVEACWLVGDMEGELKDVSVRVGDKDAEIAGTGWRVGVLEVGMTETVFGMGRCGEVVMDGNVFGDRFECFGILI